MIKPGGTKNYGWGRTSLYAGMMIINYFYGHRYSTCRSYKQRWRYYCQYLRQHHQIRDIRKINLTIQKQFAARLKSLVEEDSMAISYAVNLLSTVNIILKLMRQDSKLTLSPRKEIGARTYARTKIPLGRDAAEVKITVKAIHDKGAIPHSVVVDIARRFYLRRKEACLLDVTNAMREAISEGKIRISRGTKGGAGKNKNRSIPVTQDDILVLTKASILQGDNNNLIPQGQTLVQFMASVNYYWSKCKTETLGTIRDLRASGACNRYYTLTGHQAPIINGGVITAGPETHTFAKNQISRELGHGRPNICVAYIGRGHR